MFINNKKIKFMFSTLIVGATFTIGSTCFANSVNKTDNINNFEEEILAMSVETNSTTNSVKNSTTNSVTNSALSPISLSSNTDKYTGLIVDCRGLGLKTAMSPVIRVDGSEPIYGNKNLDVNKIITEGMASYFTFSDGTSIMPTTSRAGAHPLIVKALRLENFNTYPVLSGADAKIVMDANHSDKFFENLAVVFVK